MSTSTKETSQTLLEEPSDGAGDSSNSSTENNPIPPPQEPKAIFIREIFDLNGLESLIDLTTLPWAPKFYFVENTNDQRLTGREHITSMNGISARIEALCRFFETHPHKRADHSVMVHRVMQNFKLTFRPYFPCKDAWFGEGRLWIMYLNYTEFVMEIEEELREYPYLDKNKARFQIQGFTNAFLDEGNFMRYVEHLKRIKKKMVKFRKAIDFMVKYLGDEKRATMRILSACRRFKALQRARSGRMTRSSRPCICLTDEWEREAWALLGLPHKPSN
ncbi:hypothetical protein TWF481_005387 [Arthrobotrys musiformis]|uniref:Uncharacterized protein n=1 Tax=Arthrobotrys musiformis TaxID=47236 RepID=A0AAV9WDP2_9PEZI